MSDINADLQNLFVAAKSTNSQTSRSNAEKEILKKKKETIFDVNGDGKFDKKDINLFIKGDIDGDGKVSSEELNFIAKYKDDFAEMMTEKTGKTHKLRESSDNKSISDTEYDNNNNITAKAVFNHETQKLSNETYQNGVRNNQEVKQKDGTVNTYTYAADGKTITSCINKATDGTTVIYTYENGVRKSAVKKDNNGNKLSDYTYYTSGVNAGKLKTKTTDGVTNNYVYDDKGQRTEVNVKKGNKIQKTVTYSYETKIDSKTGETTLIQYKYDSKTQKTVKSQETITSQDGKTVTEYTYNDNGQKISGQKEVQGGAVTKYEYKDGKVSEAVVYENGEKIRVVKKDDNGNNTTYYYDSSGKLKSKKDSEGRVTAYTYDSKGVRTKGVVQDKDGKILETHTYYTSGINKGKIKTNKKADETTVTYTYNDSGKLEKTAIKDKNGKRISGTSYKDDYKITYSNFNADGEWTHSERIYNDGCSAISEKVFNNNNTYTVTRKIYDKKGKLAATHTFIYGSSGVLKDKAISWTQDNVYDSGIHRRKQEFDENGNVLWEERSTFNKKTGKLAERKRYTFKINSDGTVSTTEATVELTTYNNGSKQSVKTAKCTFGTDKNGCNYRVYEYNNGEIHKWQYNSSGVRISNTITYPADNKGKRKQLTVYFDNTGNVKDRSTQYI